MKKSQILAALALAFALGVVAPVAGTYAKTVGIRAADIAKYESDLADIKIEAGKADGTVTNLNTDEVVEAYDAYKAIWTAAKAVDAALEAADEIDDDAANGGANATVMYELKTLIGDLATDNAYADLRNLSTSLKSSIESAKKVVDRAADKDNEASVIYTQANNLLSLIKKVTVKTDANKTTRDNAITALTDAIDDVDEARDDAVKTAAAVANTGLYDVVETYVDLDGVDAPETVAEYNKFMTNVVKKNMPKYAQFVTLFEAIETAENYADAGADDPVYTSAAELNALLTKIQSAIDVLNGAAPAETPADKPEGPTDNDDKTDAPNTGALLSSDKGATTVSIVAGLATALTALGAGVVAYRNARRSSK